MQRISIIAALACAGLMCACSASSEKDASKEYVKAAQKVGAAAQAFDSADYEKADKLCREAYASVESLVEAYPESTIALKVVTDRDTRIGPCTYVDLYQKIIPALNLYSREAFKPVQLAWVIAVSQPDADARDIALEALLAKIIRANPNSEANAEQLRKMADSCIPEIRSAALKSSVAALRSAYESVPQAKAGSGALEIKTAAKDASLAAAPIENAKEFIEQSVSDAKLVAYNMRAVSNLRERALQAAAAPEAVYSEFKKALDLAYDNITKISSVQMRETALGELAAAYANIGDIARAVEIANSISTDEIFAGVFGSIAEQAGKTKNYMAAIGMIGKIPEGAGRDEFLLEIVGGTAKQGLYKEAAEIAKMLKDVSPLNSANALIANEALIAGDKKVFIESLARIDVSDLSCLRVFNVDVSEYEGEPAKTAVRLATLSRIATETDKIIAEALNNLAIDALGAGVSKEDFAGASFIIASNFAALGKASEGVDFLLGNIHLSVAQAAFENICAIASDIVAKDRDTALKAFEAAANICDSFDGDAKIKGAISLAWSMQYGGLEKGECAKILKGFLPKFM